MTGESYFRPIHFYPTTSKYRYQVLTGEVQLRCRDLLRQTRNALDVQLLKGVVSKDHIHLHISYPPSLSISDLMRRLKGRSAKLLLQEFPELKRRYWGGHFWGIGYGAWAVGNLMDDIMQAYLNHHKDHPNGEENFILEQPPFRGDLSVGFSRNRRISFAIKPMDFQSIVV